MSDYGNCDLCGEPLLYRGVPFVTLDSGWVVLMKMGGGASSRRRLSIVGPERYAEMVEQQRATTQWAHQTCAERNSYGGMFRGHSPSRGQMLPGAGFSRS